VACTAGSITDNPLHAVLNDLGKAAHRDVVAGVDKRRGGSADLTFAAAAADCM
jgi:hypothetical protein